VSGEDSELRYANIGADALAFELERAGIVPPGRATETSLLAEVLVEESGLPKPHPSKRFIDEFRGRTSGYLPEYALWTIPAESEI
jgi:hypothetical protein